MEELVQYPSKIIEKVLKFLKLSTNHFDNEFLVEDTITLMSSQCEETRDETPKVKANPKRIIVQRRSKKILTFTFKEQDEKIYSIQKSWKDWKNMVLH